MDDIFKKANKEQFKAGWSYSVDNLEKLRELLGYDIEIEAINDLLLIAENCINSNRKNFQSQLAEEKAKNDFEINKIEWSESKGTNEKVSYNHVIGKTPLGEVFITWKGWKEQPSFDLECGSIPIESWGNYSLEEAKREAQNKYNSLIKKCITTQPPQQEEGNTKPNWGDPLRNIEHDKYASLYQCEFKSIDCHYCDNGTRGTENTVCKKCGRRKPFKPDEITPPKDTQ